jgi:hypothetical protein
MIVYDFNVFRRTIAPPKTNRPLIVNADRVLSNAITLERFKPIARRRTQVVQCGGGVKKHEFASGLTFNGAKARHILIGE